MKTICIGAGPAGLTAAYKLCKENESVVVLEKDPVYVGGISRTVNYKGFKFDIGGHRFFSKSDEIEELWNEIIDGDMLERPRKSRIYYGGKFYPYPLSAWVTFRQMGVVNLFACILSYFKAKIFPIKKIISFEDWVINNFGKRLYKIFFKTYTEKVWGIECSKISADWAAQRIKGLSLFSALKNAIIPRNIFQSNNKIKTLISSFRYPRTGPGLMWEKASEKIKSMGGEIIMGAEVVSLEFKENKNWLLKYKTSDSESVLTSENIISSMPMRDLINIINPKLSYKAIAAANNLKYRDFLIVALIVKDRNVFDDNWIYIHEPNVKVGRIQNFKSWSPEMVPDKELNCYGMEYFCNEGDGLWESKDSELVEMAKSELIKLSLAKSVDIIEGVVVRQQKAYPVYDKKYSENVEIIKNEINKKFPGLYLVGRAGMHKYNNQDHAMMTAILTVKNIIAGKMLYDVWNVNQDAEYHEEVNSGSSGLRFVPEVIN